MKKLMIYFCLLSAISFLALKPHGGDKNSGQAPIGRTGAPDESSCGGCHSGGSYSGETLFQLGEQELSAYVPGETYLITYAGDYGAPRYGFSVTVLDANNEPAGDFAIINADNTALGNAGNGRQYVGHRNASANNEWMFEWTAPDDDIGPVTFYHVINAANGDNGTGGDYVETGSVTFPAAEDEDDLFVLTLEAYPPPGGTLSGGGEYEEGETIDVSASANDGYTFLDWTDEGGEQISDQPSFEYTMPAEDVLLTANFLFNTYTLTFIVEDEDGLAIDDAVITFSGESFDPGYYVFEDLPPATYEYTVTKDGYLDSSGSVVILDDDITVTVVLVEDIDTDIQDRNDFELSVYPNPASDMLNISSGSITIDAIIVYDISGKIVYQNVIHDKTHTIDVTKFRAGFYILQVYFGQQVHREKFSIM
jgi:hypothetical protein